MTPFPKPVGYLGAGLVCLVCVFVLVSKLMQHEPITIEFGLGLATAAGGALVAMFAHSATGTGGQPPDQPPTQ